MTITEHAAKNLSEFRMKAGEVVIGRRGDMGRCAVVQQHQAGWLCGTGSMIIRPVNADAEFLRRLLSSPRVISAIEDSSVGTTMVNLNQGTLAGLKLQFPLLPEQRAIATALSDMDALLDGLTRLIAKKRDLKQATMQQLLTGQTRLPGFHCSWGLKPLRYFARQFIVPMRDKPRYLAGDIPWCRIEDFDGMLLEGSKSGQGVDAETIKSMNLKVYPVGTLLVSCSADLGRCAVVGTPLVSNQTFIGIELEEQVASNVFFYYLMSSKSEDLNNLSSGTTISYLSREQFEEFKVLAPLDKAEQTAIATVLSDMDVELAGLEARLTKTRALKQAMMSELLTGKTRLPTS